MDATLTDQLSSLLLAPRGPASTGGGAEEAFRETLELIAALLIQNTAVQRVRIYCTGFAPGKFTAVVDAKVGRDNLYGDVTDTIATDDLSNEWIQRLRKCRADFSPPAAANTLFDQDLANNRIIYWLFSKGEYYGFIELTSDDLIPQRDVAFLRANLPMIGTLLADENFSFRLKFLIEAIPQAKDLDIGIDAFIEQIASQTARGFGADAATLRASEDGMLHLRSQSGAINAMLLEPRLVGEGVSGKIFQVQGPAWAALHMQTPEFDAGSIKLTDTERQELIDAGIVAAMSCKIFADPAQVDGFGTVTYLFNRPHIFSRRDINLFISYCARLSDSLQTINALSEAAERASILEVQARRMTYVEIAHLLAHDLWHKAYATQFDADEHNNALLNALKTDRLRGPEASIEAIKKSASATQGTAATLFRTASNLRALASPGGGDLYKIDRFFVEEALSTVEETLRPALSRNKITVTSRGPTGRTIQGPKLIFEQVIFNLFINSIDAARGRSKTRPMKIDITWHVQGTRLVIRYSDDGPGIDPITFPNFKDIFQIGKTSKNDGTGTGLPIARQLIGSHFGGGLGIETRQPALFTIELPLR
ncbi:ATP-binding protein [Sphingomonas sp. CJ99]